MLGQPLRGLVKHLESNCLVGCCGMDAFDISPENALAWLQTVEPEQRRLCVEQIEEVRPYFPQPAHDR